jgi:TP901 family phage tail tape measure protein
MAGGAKVIVRTEGDPSGAQRAFDEVSRKAKTTADEVRASFEEANRKWEDSAGKTLDILSRGMMATGKVLTAAITAPIIAIGALSIKAAIDFESAFAEVRKTTTATESEFRHLEQAAKDMAETKVVNASEVSHIMALGSQLGIAKEQLESFTSTIADIDVATNLGAEEAATQIAQFANITQMAQGDVGRFGSTLVDLGNNMATTEADIMSMAMRIGGAGSQIGLTNDQILAVSASLASVGISAEAGGTAISTIMSQIDKDVAHGSETLDVWAQTAGMSAEEFAAAWQSSPITALQALLRGMNDASASGGNLNLVLDSLGVTSLRQTDVMKRMTNAADLLGSSVDIASSAWRSNTALAAEASARYMTTESQLAMLQNKMQNVAATLGGPLLAGVNSLIDGAQPLLDALKGVAQGFASLPAPVQTSLVTFAGLTAGIGPLVMAGGKLLSVTKSVTEGYMQLAAKAAIAKAAKLADAGATATETLATTSNTAARAANTGVMIGSSGVRSADTAATVANTGAKAANTGATGVLTVAQYALNTAMAANPVGAAILGITALVGIMVALAAIVSSTAGEQENLTSSSQAQKDEIDELADRYEHLTDEEKQNAAVGGQLKAQIDDMTASYESNNMTVEQLTEAIQKSEEEHGQLAAQFAAQRAEIANEGGALLNLAERYEELAAKTTLSKDEQGELSAVSQMLANSVDGLGESYDETTGRLNDNTDAIHSLIEAQIAQAKQAANIDRLKEVYIELEAQMKLVATAQQDAAAAEAAYVAENQRISDQIGGDASNAYNSYSLALTEAAGRQKEAEDTAEGLKNEISYLTGEIGREALETDNASGLVEQLGYAYEYTAAECEEAGTTIERVNEILAQHTVVVQDAISAIDEYTATNPAFAAAMADAGYTSEGLQVRLESLGIEFGDLTASTEEWVARATDGFSTLSTESGISLEKIMENLAHNAEVTAAWSDNTAAAWGNAKTAGAQAFVEYLAGQGVEQAGNAMAQLAGMTAEQTDEMAKQWSGYGGQIAPNIAGPEIIAQVGAGGESIALALNEPLEEGAEQAAETGTEAGTGYAESVAAEEGAAQQAGAALGNAARTGLYAAFPLATARNYGSELGSNLAGGLLSQLPALQAASSAAAAALAADVKHSVPRPESPLHDEAKWMGHMVDNLVAGLRANEGRLTNEVYAMTSKMAGGFEHMADAGYVVGATVPLNEASPRYRGTRIDTPAKAANITNVTIDGLSFNDNPRIVALFNEFLREYVAVAG